MHGPKASTRHPWWDRVIVALDHPSFVQCMTWVRSLRPWVVWFKVGPVALLRHGPHLIHALHRTGARVFLDVKLHDIPNVMERALEAARHMDVEMVSVHALNGPDVLRGLIEVVRQWSSRPMLVAITVLTSLDRVPWDPFQAPASWAERLAAWAHEAGLDGVVCSAWEVASIRARFGLRFHTVVPGIRLTAPKDDQRRWATPWEALQAGADWVVMGRALTGMADIEAACQTLNSRFWEIAPG